MAMLSESRRPGNRKAPAHPRPGRDLRGSLRDRTLREYIETHPEKELLAFVQVETSNWLQRVVPNESDKYVVMAAFNFVNCIAFAPMPASKG